MHAFCRCTTPFCIGLSLQLRLQLQLQLRLAAKTFNRCSHQKRVCRCSSSSPSRTAVQLACSVVVLDAARHVMGMDWTELDWSVSREGEHPERCWQGLLSFPGIKLKITHRSLQNRLRYSTFQQPWRAHTHTHTTEHRASATASGNNSLPSPELLPSKAPVYDSEQSQRRDRNRTEVNSTSTVVFVRLSFYESIYNSSSDPAQHLYSPSRPAAGMRAKWLNG